MGKHRGLVWLGDWRLLIISAHGETWKLSLYAFMLLVHGKSDREGGLTNCKAIFLHSKEHGRMNYKDTVPYMSAFL